jgi:hypothetical protein
MRQPWGDCRPRPLLLVAQLQECAKAKRPANTAAFVDLLSHPAQQGRTA